MIKLGNKNMTPRGYSKVMKGSSLVWQKVVDKLVYSDAYKSEYNFKVFLGNNIVPNKNYKFIADIDYFEFFIKIKDKENKIKTGDVFTVTGNCDIKIINNRDGYFGIKIYETQSKANLVIDATSGDSGYINNNASDIQMTFGSISEMSPYASTILIRKALSNILAGKTIISVNIDGFKKIAGAKAKLRGDGIEFTDSFDVLIGATDFIRKGTKITITYK